MTTIESLKHCFGKNIPPLLVRLAEYFDNNSGFFSGSFEVSGDTYDGKKEWFKGNEEGYTKILVFGHDGVGSLIGLWVKDKSVDPDNAPVIYLGGEGGGTILAPNLHEYLSILATNRDWEPFDGEFMDPEEDNEEENKKFRKWLKNEFDITPAKDPKKVLEKGRKIYPDFNDWLVKVKPE